MKKLKSIFSPRHLIVWIFLLILILTIPEITNPAMSKTEAIVTMLSIDKKDEKIIVATSVLTPAMEKTANYEVYTGEGDTIDEAIENVSLAIGKSIGFAQCEIMAFGDKISERSIIPSLDYMTRTRKLGRNAMLINFSGEASEFAQAVINLNVEKSLSLEDIMNFDKRFILSSESSIDAFYKGYFSEISLGIMPKVKLSKEKTTNAIEVQQSSVGGGSATEPGSGGNGDSEKLYILNDGTTSVFKKGEKTIEISPDKIKELNIFLNKSQEGTLKVVGVTDHLYNDDTIILHLSEKSLSYKPEFKEGKPVYNIEVDLTVLVEEVVEKDPTKRFLRRNKEFLTDALIRKLTEQIKQEGYDTIAYCQENKIDLLRVYEQFYRKKYKEFKSYYEKQQEKYLDEIEYNISVKVSSTY